MCVHNSGFTVCEVYYSDIIMGTMAPQITSLTIVYSTILFGRRSKETSKLRVAGLCAGNSPVTGEFPAQMASNAENVSIWWHHHVIRILINRIPVWYSGIFLPGCLLRDEANNRWSRSISKFSGPLRADINSFEGMDEKSHLSFYVGCNHSSIS